MAEVIGGTTITHYGLVSFENGKYTKLVGSNDWQVFPVPAFEIPSPANRPAVGQIQISFKTALDTAYCVLVTAVRLPTSPLLSANVGNINKDGFVVHLFETVADRTLQNGGFSFLVLSNQ